MKRLFTLSALAVFAAILLISPGCKSCKNKGRNDFQFVFMTDIHLTHERNAVAGFKQALQKVNDIRPDFVITGGDLIMDALKQSYSGADSLYNLYIETIKDFRIPVYNTMGNHEIFGIYSESGADPFHPEYGEKMFEKRIGKSYYSFDHKGWKFIIINSIEDTKRNRYAGMIDEKQIEWIREELSKTDKKTPLVISTHIPFITVNTQLYKGTTVANDSSTVVFNGRQVLELFKDHNLKLVLQGHLHTVEDIFIGGVHFVTSGAVSGGWWKGPNRGFEEGFMLVSVEKDEVACKYIDYGWEVK
jgi:3',5'-cyclic AMP phosphodiesterase CpdA